MQRIRVWDLPTRLFHWILALTIIGSVISAKIGGNAMTWHFRFGYLVLALLVFRLLWGFVGGHWSRFASFIYSPSAVLRYVRGDTRRGDHFEVGHNPLGSFSVFALLVFLIVQVSTGLIADDEIANVGPLNKLVSTATGLLATGWHKQFGQWIIITLVVLHIGAIVFYAVVKKTNLWRPMIDGDKLLPADTPASNDGAARRVLALALAAIGAALAVWVMRQGS